MTAVILISLGGLAAALILSCIRALKGPTVADRVVALDTISTIIIAVLVTGSMLVKKTHYLSYALVMGVLSYVSTVAFAKYVERGVVIERNSR